MLLLIWRSENCKIRNYYNFVPYWQPPVHPHAKYWRTGQLRQTIRVCNVAWCVRSERVCSMSLSVQGRRFGCRSSFFDVVPSQLAASCHIALFRMQELSFSSVVRLHLPKGVRSAIFRLWMVEVSKGLKFAPSPVRQPWQQILFPCLPVGVVLLRHQEAWFRPDWLRAVLVSCGSD